MDVKPIYELRTRMRAAAIAGTNLLAEDFRFKKVAEAIKPLETASPVFAKIGEYVHTLLTQECPTPAQTLLEALTLVDSVLCTLCYAAFHSAVRRTYRSQCTVFFAVSSAGSSYIIEWKSLCVYL